MTDSEQCAHCGAEVQGYATVNGVRVCHFGDPARPDCYTRITVHREPIGILLALPDKPPRTERIVDGWHTWLEFLDTSLEVEAKSTVCITHKRFIPCRATLGCIISVRPEDVESVRAYQQGGNQNLRRGA